MPGEAWFWFADAAFGIGRIAERAIRTAAIGPVSLMAEYWDEPGRPLQRLGAQHVIAKRDGVRISDLASASKRKIAIGSQCAAP
jgi:hypothetical protein